MHKLFSGLAFCLCVLAASTARAQTIHVLDTGDPAERICNPKSYTDLGNGIVRDNVTGLEWVQDGNLMATRNPEFDNDSDRYGGIAGDGGVTWQHALDYIALLNADEYLGYTDWRLPSIEELSTLVDAGRYSPAIDPIFSTVPVGYGYWSSTSSTSNVDARCLVSFQDGLLSSAHKRYNNFVRPVRGGSYGPSDNFVSNANGTVTDQNTGLMWQRCSYGQTWDGNACTGDASCMEGTMAVSYVQQLNAGNYLGYRDWRLPTSNEQQSLLDYNLANPSTAFPDTVLLGYWSSTIYANNSDYLWFVAFEHGGAWRWEKSECIFYVRAVRGGSCRADGDWCIDDSDCEDDYQCTEGSCVSIPHPGQWTWMSGADAGAQEGIYGTRGIPGGANVPGGRELGVSWTDSTGSLWLFGGLGFDSVGTRSFLNDLWRYDIVSGEWTWMSGADTVNQSGIYGTRGVPDAANVPGARDGSVSWTDSTGNLWLFGGLGFDSAGTGSSLNDLWRYDIASGDWTWMSGADTANQSGVYGTRGVPDAANVPGARTGSVAWTDTSGQLWLFGGEGKARLYSSGILNDLWVYNPISGLWTWVSGADTSNQTGVYGIKGTPDAVNVPGFRAYSVSWTDSAGKLWLFGGFYSSGFWANFLNDLWRYDPETNLWTWKSGSDTINQTGVYGTMGVPEAANVPGARGASVSWTDSSGNLWLFGGFQSTGSASFPVSNDLWRFDPETNLWTWMSGADTGCLGGVYGTRGEPDPDNIPGARQRSAAWMDSSGNLWLFGGHGRLSSGSWDDLNDLWRYELPRCTSDSECSEGYQCVDRVCEQIPDNPPALTAGPYLAAGTWPVLSTSPESPMYLDADYDVLWAFSDDYGSCSEACTHIAEYQAVGGSEWTALAVTATANGYAYVTLPIESLQNATTYAFRYSVTDCASQTTQSVTYYFRVAITDAPPVITSGPFVAAGAWPVLATSSSRATVLDQNEYVLWTFSDDYAFCSGLCTHRARYRKVGDTVWTWIPVSADPTGRKYAYTELPVAGLAAGTYQFYFDVRDCEGQRTSAPKIYYFKVE